MSSILFKISAAMLAGAIMLAPAGCVVTEEQSNESISKADVLKRLQMEKLRQEAKTGARLDLDTNDPRVHGYFTNLRKAIELVWDYPIDASKNGIAGVVFLQWVIHRDGEIPDIEVLKSSGHELLDQNMIDTLKLVSPAARLPNTLHRERITVTGRFNYVLTQPPKG